MSQNTDVPGEDQQKPNAEIPPNSQPATGTGTESTTTTNTLTDQIKKDMEVHHHGHVHERKKWKEYVFQFFMLLLAVFLGSYAETKREELTERHKEKDYIISMIEDIKKDITEGRARYNSIFNQVQIIDSIQSLFTHDLKNNESEVATCYELSMYLPYYATVGFNENTISQLISTGNMRLIKRNGAADSIMAYYSAIKTIDLQKHQYIDYINVMFRSMYKVFDVNYLNLSMRPADTSIHFAINTWAGIKLLTYDAASLKELSATLETTNLVIFNYMEQLGYILKNADGLIAFLKKEYDIKEKPEITD